MRVLLLAIIAVFFVLCERSRARIHARTRLQALENLRPELERPFDNKSAAQRGRGML
jgi:hypothetical protein